MYVENKWLASLRLIELQVPPPDVVHALHGLFSASDFKGRKKFLPME
jgi:hypothetical protein